MKLNYNCLGCGRSYQFSADKAGRRFRCRDCNTVAVLELGTLPKRARKSSTKPSKTSSPKASGQLIRIGIPVAALGMLVIMVSVAVVFGVRSQPVSDDAANMLDNNGPQVTDNAGDMDANEAVAQDALQPAGAQPAAAQPAVAVVPRPPDAPVPPPDGELELLEQINVKQLTDPARLQQATMTETDHVDPGGGFRNKYDVVWTNTKTYTNPNVPDDYVVTIDVQSHYQSRSGGSTIVNAGGSVAGRQIPIAVFKSPTAGSTYLGPFKFRSTFVQFKGSKPEHFGRFGGDLRYGKWSLFHSNSDVQRVSGSYQAGKTAWAFSMF